MGIFRQKEGVDPSGLYVGDQASAPQDYPPGYPPGRAAPAQGRPGYLAGAWSSNPARSNPPVRYRHRRSPLGMATMVFFILLAVAVPVFFGIRTFTVPGGAFGPPLVMTTGVPATVKYDGAEMAVTFGRPTTQPGAEWDDARQGDRPYVVVPVTVHRVDTGSKGVDIETWDWHLQPAVEGARVDGELISDYIRGDVDGTPSRDSTPTLHAGDTYRGTIAFRSAAEAGTITLNNPDTSSAVLLWTYSAEAARVVVGTFGKPVRAVIGLPAFQVTASTPVWIRAGDPTIDVPPKSGTYLTVELTFVGDPTASSEDVDSSDLVFVPAGKSAVASATDSVSDAFFYTTVGADETVKGKVAFDAGKGRGTLELLDRAGRTVVAWPVPN